MLGDQARRSGMQVRGVMGYEGHVVGIPDREQREQGCRDSMDLLATAHQAVGGDVISAGGTGTFDCNGLATEIQAGSYALMDTAYGKCGMPFRQALFIESTIISVSSDYAVADCGLKALGMDHGAPDVDGGAVWFCSDEHITFAPDRALHVGDRVRIVPAHVDPTVAYHESIHVVSETEIVETWEIDLRGW
jgi:D-serine deaminase-like pyridoxal phosphate-dependent protein